MQASQSSNLKMLLRCKNPLNYLEAFRNYTKSPWILQTSGFSDIPFKKPKLAPLQERRMIDQRRLCSKGGDGGNGCISFHRSRHDRRGKADGGNGGRGGDVILECSPTVWDLSNVQHHINAQRGGHGTSKNKIGSRGDDKVILVPVGTVLHHVKGDIPLRTVVKRFTAPVNPWEVPDTFENSQPKVESKEMKIPKLSSNVGSKSSGDSERFDLWDEKKMSAWEGGVNGNRLSESDEMEDTEKEVVVVVEEEEEEEEEEEYVRYNMDELTEPGDRIVVAYGGEGGLGNVHLSQTFKKNYSHKKRNEIGKSNDTEVQEEEEDIENSSIRLGCRGAESVLILELKSIADVGLVGMPNAGKSTLLGALSKAQPKIGHYAFTTLRPNLGNLTFDDLSVTVADIPGLIKGAHENRGLGHAFLRHIERTKVLAYVLDLVAGLDGRKGVPPWEQLKDLISELELYNAGLSGRPALIVANKIDEDGAEEVYDELRRRVSCVNIFPVCAVLGEGVTEVKDGLRMLVSGEDSNRLTLDDIHVD